MRWLLALPFLVLWTLPLSAQDTLAQQVSVFFAGGSYYIFPEEGDKLREFLDAVPDLAAYGIELQGHTDDIGDPEYNLRLSAARAEMVRRWLLEYEVPPHAIETLPLGEESPSYDNTTWEGKLSNRRVDVILKPIM